MNPSKTEEEEMGSGSNDVDNNDNNPFFHHHHHHHHRQIILSREDDNHSQQPSIHQLLQSHPFSLIYRHSTDNDPADDTNSSPNPSDDDPDDSLRLPPPPTMKSTSDLPLSVPDSSPSTAFSNHQASSFTNPNRRTTGYVDPAPHISTQFYTFNSESHSLMIRCLAEGRLATPAEIRAATHPEVLKSWRAVWRDRNEDTAYTTGWKRIQEKLQTHADETGNRFLCFKNNSQQFVSHFSQWQDIVTSFHGDSDLKHLGLRETIDRIKQVWTVGAKFYGIPESFIRICVASCPVCSGNGERGADGTSGAACGLGRPKRRRFEYTESFDVPAREVPNKLQQLAKKHKVVLCIRQKYIRYKPFMAEVKDYACHRAGEPTSKKPSKALKREPYASKRCGCGFRIRAIVPIANYNDKDKTFVYQEEGIAVFKLYAVHTGHKPGPLDGNARIMHRVVGHKGVGFLLDDDDDEEEAEYGVNEAMVEESHDVLFSSLGGGVRGSAGEDDYRLRIAHQLQELKSELGFLERKVGMIPHELLGSVSGVLYEIANKVRLLGDHTPSKVVGLLSDNMKNNKPPNSDLLLGESDLSHWSDAHGETLYEDGKETDLIDDDEDSFGRTLGEVAGWDQVGPTTTTDCNNQKDHRMIGENCKADKWLKFDDKGFLNIEGESKLSKSIRQDHVDHIEADDDDVGLVGIQVDSFYPENPKLYDSPCGLDSSTDCGDNGFRHRQIV